MMVQSGEHRDGDTLSTDTLTLPEGAIVIEVSWRAKRVYDALSRLMGGEVSWTGPQREIARVAGYKSLRTISDALAELEEDAGLLMSQEQGNGRVRTYYLRAAAPSGEPYVIRTAPAPAIAGRDVIRAAGASRVAPLPPASQTYATPHAATYATPPQEPQQSDAISDAPSMSSESSSALLLRDAAAVAWTAEQAVVAEHLRDLRIEPEPDVVFAIAELTPERAADCWMRIERWARPEGSTPEFVRCCIASTLEIFPLVAPAPPQAGTTPTTTAQADEPEATVHETTRPEHAAAMRAAPRGTTASATAAALVALGHEPDAALVDAIAAMDPRGRRIFWQRLAARPNAPTASPRAVPPLASTRAVIPEHRAGWRVSVARAALSALDAVWPRREPAR